ncbi:MBL fold metallo-hydrolase [Clostridium sp. WILCCON 0269]|uniref:MBL fold metallo-hydrolase n=1 Tax=Candidatus Clostridium eludens TaxID=3381663 RepID=A0ABW8SJL2_9CLOT
MLNFLGRGSAFNIREGNNSAFIKENTELLLIDCGENIFERILNKHLLHDIKNVHVLITHLDSDHVGSLSSLIYYCYYIKHIVVNIYFPHKSLYHLLHLHGHRDRHDYNFHYLNVNTNNFHRFAAITSIKPISVSHIDTLKCFGYLLYLKSGRLIWYSGDCNKVSHVIYKYNIDEIYHDTCLADYSGNVHTSLKLLCKSIPKDKRNKVYCMHIDCDELIAKAQIEGFKVVEINKNILH